MTKPQDQQYTIEITRLGGLGDGSGLHDGKPVFVAKSCVGDVLKVEPTSKDRAEIAEIITPGKDRVTAPCPHYAACGGCSLQHLSTEAYQQFKRDAVATSLSYAGFAEIVPQFHFLPAASRRRADFKVQDGKLAYLAGRSHDRVAIDQCLILTPRLQALIAPLSELLTNAGAVQITQADSGVDIQIEGDVAEAALKAFAEKHDIARINHFERKPVTMRFGAVDVKLPPDAFLQASKEAETLMVSLVAKHVGDAKSIVEFFAGLGTYTFALAANAHVTAYELDAAMVAALRHSRIKSSRRDLFKQPLPAKELKGYHAAIINPPRNGADAQTRELAASGIPTIVMVSCNHSTFSRDAKTLKNAGYKLVSVDIIDQFVYSPHVEIVSIFSR